MSWDIHGNPLRSGHCEVHPTVAQVYPCSMCFQQNRIDQANAKIKDLEEKLRVAKLAIEGALAISDAWMPSFDNVPVHTSENMALCTMYNDFIAIIEKPKENDKESGG